MHIEKLEEDPDGSITAIADRLRNNLQARVDVHKQTLVLRPLLWEIYM